MSIPTGADYHILNAKSAIADSEDRFFREQIQDLQKAVSELIKALELIRQEQERKDQ